MDLTIAAEAITFLDFGPIFEAWEADFGRTYVLGDEPAKIALRDSRVGVGARLQLLSCTPTARCVGVMHGHRQCTFETGSSHMPPGPRERNVTVRTIVGFRAVTRASYGRSKGRIIRFGTVPQGGPRCPTSSHPTRSRR